MLGVDPDGAGVLAQGVWVPAATMRSMDGMLSEAAKVVVGVIGAGLVATISPLFRTARRLRDEVRATEFLERVPRSARLELRRELNRRTHLLVSLTRYPPVTRVDVLAFGAWVIAGAFAVSTGLNVPADVAVNEVIVAATLTSAIGYAAFGSFSTTHRAWVDRAGRRVAYLDQQTGRDEAMTTARMIRTGDALLGLVPIPLGVALFAPIAFALNELTSPQVGATVCILATPGLVVLSCTACRRFIALSRMCSPRSTPSPCVVLPKTQRANPGAPAPLSRAHTQEHQVSRLLPSDLTCTERGPVAHVATEMPFSVSWTAPRGCRRAGPSRQAECACGWATLNAIRPCANPPPARIALATQDASASSPMMAPAFMAFSLCASMR